MCYPDLLLFSHDLFLRISFVRRFIARAFIHTLLITYTVGTVQRAGVSVTFQVQAALSQGSFTS